MAHTEQYDFPVLVFREAITNAIAHRDYDIEGAPIYFTITEEAIIIKSPGLPFSPITLEQIKNLNAPSFSRNPKLMFVFSQLKLVEQRGLGFTTIKDLLGKYNLPLPVITFDNPYLTITFPRSKSVIRSFISNNKSLKQLTDEELIGYDFIRRKTKLTKKDYANNFNYSERQAERHFKKFTELGLVERKGAGPSTNYEIIPT